MPLYIDSKDDFFLFCHTVGPVGFDFPNQGLNPEHSSESAKC